MPRYQVTAREVRFYDVYVEAENSEEAEKLAEEIPDAEWELDSHAGERSIEFVRLA